MVARGSRPGPLRPSTPLRSMGAARITLQISKRYSEPTGRSRARRRGRPRQPHHQDGSSRQSLQRTPPTRNRSGRTHHTGSRPTSISSTQTIIKPKCLHSSSQASTRRTWQDIRNNHRGIHQRACNAHQERRQCRANGIQFSNFPPIHHPTSTHPWDRRQSDRWQHRWDCTRRRLTPQSLCSPRERSWEIQ